MKKLTKRLAALLLAAVSLAALSVPALASSSLEVNHNNYLNLTVNGADAGQTVYIIELMGRANESTSYELPAETDPYFLSPGGVKVFKALGAKTGSGFPQLDTSLNPDSQDDDAWKTAAAAVAESLSGLDTVSEKRAAADAIADEINAWNESDKSTYDYGEYSSNMTVYAGCYYLIVCEGTAPILYEFATTLTENADVTVDLKASYPSMSSAMSSSDSAVVADSAAAGEEVTFTLTSTVPDLSDYTANDSNFVFSFVDILPAGLAYKSCTLQYTHNGSTATEAADGAVQVSPDTTTNTVTLDIGTWMLGKCKATTPSLSTGDAVIMTVKATVTASAAPVNVNKTYLECSFDSGDPTYHYETAKDETYVYTYNLPVKVVDKKDGTTPLEGAVFVLKNSSGNYYNADTGAWSTDSTADGCKFTTGSDGTVSVPRLGDGTYTLEQTAASTGYDKMTEGIPVIVGSTVNATNAVWTVSTTSSSDDVSVPSGWSVTVNNTDTTINQGGNVITVKNAAKVILPTTGAYGTALIIALGVAAVIAGVAAADRKRGRG